MESAPELLVQRPKRADALRNYEKLIEAARDAFAQHGAATSLEEIARRAQVGIGTLYRHFPTRQDLLEAVYVEEVERMCRSADDLGDLPPWDALVAWLHRFVGYVGTKRALAEQLTAALGAPTAVFAQCRQALFTYGEPLLARAQESGAVRGDVSFGDVLHMVSGITMANFAEEAQMERVLDIALDGLRTR